MTKRGFNIMAFPMGPLCNLNCRYCYYLDKVELYQNTGRIQMSEALLEEFIRQYIEAHQGPELVFGWQGGEPTLRGLEFYKQVVKLQKKHLPPGWRCQNSFQTNGTLLDDAWCEFFKENNFLVGISLDGPEAIHDLWRRDKEDRATHDGVVRAIHLLKKYDVEYNVLCVVNEHNARFPLEVYAFYKNLGVEFVQFIPLVESGARQATEYSVPPGAYASFLISIFNEWLQHDFGEVFVQIFEESLRIWAGYGAALCVFSETCGHAMVMEHNGDLYSCDHFVAPEFKLGNILETPIKVLINSKQQEQFGKAKQDSLAKACFECEYRFVCQGECPKNRIVETETGETLNYLCSDYKRFFGYIAPYMELMARGIRARHPLSEIQAEALRLYHQRWNVGRNDDCPCGSRIKFKKCCMN